jgi:hypothetical protein
VHEYSFLHVMRTIRPLTGILLGILVASTLAVAVASSPLWSAQILAMRFVQLPGFGSFNVPSASQVAGTHAAPGGQVVFQTADGTRRVEWSDAAWLAADPRDGRMLIVQQWWGRLSRVQQTTRSDNTVRSLEFGPDGQPQLIRTVAYEAGGTPLRSAQYRPSVARIGWSGTCASGAQCFVPPEAMTGAMLLNVVIPSASGSTIVLREWDFGGQPLSFTFEKQRKSFAFDSVNRVINETTTGTGTARVVRWVDAVNGAGSGRTKVVGNFYAYPYEQVESIVLPSGATITPHISYPRMNALVVSTGDADIVAVRASSGVHAMFKAAIDKVRATGASMLRIEPGTYLFEAPANLNQDLGLLELVRLRDVLVDGQGAELVFQGFRPGLVVRNSDRVRIQNLKIDWADRLAFTGEMGKREGETYFLANQSSLPASETAPPIVVLAGFDPVNARWRTGDIVNSAAADFDISFARDRSQSGSIAYAGMFGGRHAYRISAPYRVRDVPVGTTMMATRRANGTYAVGIAGGSNDISLDGVTVFASPGVGFSANGAGRGIQLKNSIITRKPGKPYSTLGDGFVANSRGDVFIEDNTFDSMGDDGFNLYGTYHRISSAGVSASRTVIKVQDDLVPSWGTGGDLISFYDSGSLEPIVSVPLLAVVAAGNAGCAAGPGSCLTFASPLPAGVSSNEFALNIDRSSQRFVVRGNRVLRNRGRMMLVQTARGIVENNQAAGQESGGIWLLNDAAVWNDGPGPSDVIIRGNTIENTGYGTSAEDRAFLARRETGFGPAAAIMVQSRIPLQMLSTANGVNPYRAFRNIVIENNVIRRFPGLGLFISSAANVIVRGNSFLETNTHRFPAGATATGSAMVYRANDVTLLNNVFSGPLFVEPSTTDAVTIDGLLQP